MIINLAEFEREMNYRHVKHPEKQNQHLQNQSIFTTLITRSSDRAKLSCRHLPIHLPQVVMCVNVVWRVPDGGQEVAFRLLRTTHECPQVVVCTRVSWPQSAK